MGAEWQSIADMGGSMMADSLRFVNQNGFAEALHKAQAGAEINVVTAQRVLALEYWLRRMEKQAFLCLPPPTGTYRGRAEGEIGFELTAH